MEEAVEERRAQMEAEGKTPREVLEKTRFISEKNATPGDGARSSEGCLENIRPTAMTLDRSAQACSDPEALRAGVLERFGDLFINIGTEFVNQYHSKYFSQILPFVIPRMVSGPDFANQPKWRRIEASHDRPG